MLGLVDPFRDRVQVPRIITLIIKKEYADRLPFPCYKIVFAPQNMNSLNCLCMRPNGDFY